MNQNSNNMSTMVLAERVMLLGNFALSDALPLCLGQVSTKLPLYQLELPLYTMDQPLSVPMIENIGRNMPATMKPTITPRNTISIGSSAAVRLLTASSTSRS